MRLVYLFGFINIVYPWGQREKRIILQFINLKKCSVFMTHLTTRWMTYISRIGSNIGWKLRGQVVRSGLPGELPRQSPIKGVPGHRGRIDQWIITGGSLKSSLTTRAKYPTLYPFLLSKEQKKGVSTGVSIWAIGQLLIAVVIAGMWVKSLFNSFNVVKAPAKIPTLSLGGVVPLDYALTPTATPWTVLEGQGQISTPTPESTPTVVPVVPSSTPTVTPSPTPWFTGMSIPDSPGYAYRPSWAVGDPDEVINAKISYYYPPFAYNPPDASWLINCDTNPDGSPECETLANGYKTYDWIGYVVACPEEFPYGTVFQIWNKYYLCYDRGGAITRETDNLIWLDILYNRMPDGHYWSESTTISLWLPK